jgi:hypothetical protein
MLASRPPGGRAYDWTAVALGFWFLGGLFLDGWAHNHLPELESFFTPWHAVFYSGFLAVAAFLLVTMIRNHAKGYSWRRAMPPGYEHAVTGVLIFAVGGLGDMVWHELFGVEADVEALLSPTHLILALGGTLILSAPLHAGWLRQEVEDSGTFRWQALLPVLLSLTFVLSLWSFFTQFAHPLVDTWAAAGYRPPGPKGLTLLRQALGVSGFLLQTGILMGLVLLAMRRWTLLLGSLTLVFTLNAALMSFMRDQYRFIPAAAAAGLTADLLIRHLRPALERPGAWRVCACAVPMIYYTFYYLALIITQGLGWSVHLWTGSIVLSGIVGLLLSYLVLPPFQAWLPTPTPSLWEHSGSQES